MKKPKIRFKGFRGEWEEHSLAETEFSIIAGGDIDRTIFKKCGNYPVIANGITYDGILGYYENSYRVKGPAVTVTGRGEVGVAVPRHYSFTPVVRLLAIKSSHNVDLLANAINLCKVPIESTGVPQLTTSKLQEYNVFMPQTLDEEDKLASYFQHLDSLIQSTTKKIESLKQVKAASLQSMFPQEGETTPRVRFKGFEGEWEKVRASNVFKTFNEKNRPDLPVLSATQDRGMVNRESIGYNIFHDKSNEATYKHILPGQFIIHLRSFQGGFAHSSIEGIASPAYTIMEFKDKTRHFDLYWKYIFVSKEFIKRLELITYGIRDGRSISFEEFSEMYFTVPSYEEQKKIASYITTLDRQITLQTQRLEKLKQIKAACLDNMFV